MVIPLVAGYKRLWWQWEEKCSCWATFNLVSNNWRPLILLRYPNKLTISRKRPANASFIFSRSYLWVIMGAFVQFPFPGLGITGYLGTCERLVTLTLQNCGFVSAKTYPAVTWQTVIKNVLGGHYMTWQYILKRKVTGTKPRNKTSLSLVACKCAYIWINWLRFLLCRGLFRTAYLFSP